MIRILCILLILTITMPAEAQKSRSKNTKKTSQKYPASFTIDKTMFSSLFNYKVGDTVTLKTNPYINKSQMLMNSRNGDIKFLRFKLSYFKNAYLLVQENGEYSTQVFIMSDDKSVFYKGSVGPDKVVMTKCSEDEIVSE
jgi:hypothetical protein